MAKWYAGVTHSHTNNSDGVLTPEELVKLAEKNKLDFLMITDHNQFCEEIPTSDKLTVIPGTELTKHGGHTNIWGVKHPIDNFDCETYEEWLDKVAQAKQNGATVCINHPLCSNCPWRWPLEPEKADCLEVWNAPQHTDNMRCTEFWQNELRAGKKIPVVGGSDYHRDYAVTNLLTWPVTYVYAESNGQDDILTAIRAGHTTVSSGVGKTMIEITCEDNMMGDTVKLGDKTEITVIVTNIKKGHTLKVIGKNGVIYSEKVRKSGKYEKTLPIENTNFICVQTERKLNPLFERVYNKYAVKLTKETPGKLPAFISAQSGAIYFE